MRQNDPIPGGRPDRDVWRSPKFLDYVEMYRQKVQEAPGTFPPISKPLNPYQGCSLRLCPLCEARK